MTEIHLHFYSISAASDPLRPPRPQGRLAVGMDADITAFDPGTVLDRATLAEPSLPSAGVQFVLVNGTLVVDMGKETGALPGVGGRCCPAPSDWNLAYVTRVLVTKVTTFARTIQRAVRGQSRLSAVNGERRRKVQKTTKLFSTMLAGQNADFLTGIDC